MTDAADFRRRLQSTLGTAYVLERELGGGGMSRVFLARERRLERDVVVKVLSPELAEGVSAERFERELRTVARLQHPNIVPVLAAGSSDGLPYYTMPFIRGESLRAQLTAGTVTRASAVRLLGHVAHALAHAHTEGVVHRDIKPENVLIADGIAVVTDFGISKALDVSRASQPGDALTQRGVALGTPAYMAPEQAAGDPDTDLRADLYAWAVVAYECLTGAHPFAGRRTSHAYIAAHMAERPVPIAERTSAVPPALADLIMRCLEKDPNERPASARALLDVLESSLAMSGADASRTTPPRGLAATPGIPSIAVLPFLNLSADAENEYFSDGITEEIRNLLAQDRTLRVAARSSSFAFKGKPTDPRTIADQLSVRTLLEGSVRRIGNRVRIATQLVNASDGFQMWSQRFDRELTDIFAVQDEIASSIAATLRSALHVGGGGMALPSVGAAPDVQPTRRARQSVTVEAYDAYLKGRYLNHRRGEGHREAITHFQRALSLDPAFAPALAGLAEAYQWLAIAMVLPPTEAFTRARRYAQHALALDPALADAHCMLGEIAFWHEWDSDAARRHVQHALALEPRSADALQLSARLHAVAGRHADAVADVDAAVEADPASLGTQWAAVVTAYLVGDYQRAIDACERVIARDPAYADGYRWRGKARFAAGDIERGLSDLQAAARLGHALPWLPAEIAAALCLTGRFDEARQIRDDLVRQSERGWIPPSAIVVVEQALGNHDAAFRWLERAYETRDFLCVVLPLEGAVLASVPGSPRFVDDRRWQDFVRRVGMVAMPRAT